jgi:hypothetical protein
VTCHCGWGSPEIPECCWFGCLLAISCRIQITLKPSATGLFDMSSAEMSPGRCRMTAFIGLLSLVWAIYAHQDHYGRIIRHFLTTLMPSREVWCSKLPFVMFLMSLKLHEVDRWGQDDGTRPYWSHGCRLLLWGGTLVMPRLLPWCPTPAVWRFLVGVTGRGADVATDSSGTGVLFRQS